MIVEWFFAIVGVVLFSLWLMVLLATGEFLLWGWVIFRGVFYTGVTPGNIEEPILTMIDTGLMIVTGIRFMVHASASDWSANFNER